MRIKSFDGTEIAVHEAGAGKPLLLFHGLFSSAQINWIGPKTAEKLANAGYHVLMPDLRGHGKSDAPDGAEYWPADVLVRDAEAIVQELGLSDDLVIGGYSLGVRVTVQYLARRLAAGGKVRGAILAGMGLTGVSSASGIRADMFARVIRNHMEGITPERTDPLYEPQRFLVRSVPNPAPLRHLMAQLQEGQQVDLNDLTLPILVTAGKDDLVNGSAAELADALPDGRYAEIPGNHMSAPSRPELAQVMIDFLDQL